MNIESKLLSASRRILQPLVRVLLRNGIPSDTLTELVRKTYVDVAQEEFGIEGKRQTVGRIAVITGLNRKEVSRLKKQPPLDRSAEKHWNRAAKVLSGWMRDKDFQDRKGDPDDLDFAGSPNSFHELVGRYSGDMRPRSVADELMRLGAIEQVGDKLRMTTRGYVPASDPEYMINILGSDTAELIETIDHNLQSEDDKFYQMKVRYDNVPAEHEEEFRDMSDRLMQAVLEQLDRWLGKRDQGRKPAGEGERRLTLGMGVFQIISDGYPIPQDAPDADKEDHTDE